MTRHDEAERAANLIVRDCKHSGYTPHQAMVGLGNKAPRGDGTTWDDVHNATAIAWLKLND